VDSAVGQAERRTGLISASEADKSRVTSVAVAGGNLLNCLTVAQSPAGEMFHSTM
jgi:hypothetical protein